MESGGSEPARGAGLLGAQEEKGRGKEERGRGKEAQIAGKLPGSVVGFPGSIVGLPGFAFSSGKTALSA
jgi:hypothetical protein